MAEARGLRPAAVTADPDVAFVNIGHSGRKVLIVLNDNGRSYAPTVSRLASGLSRLRLNPAYVRNVKRLQRIVRKVPMVGQQLEIGMSGLRAAVREVLCSRRLLRGPRRALRRPH